MADYAFRDAAGLATAARWALYGDSLVCAAVVAVALVQGPLALQFGDLAGPLAILQFVTWLGSLILFLSWFYRANANVRAMGADGLTGSPGLSVAWFFIPIAFLFMPFVVMRDTWKASESPRDWQGQPTNPLLGFWWAAFLVANLAATFSFRLSLSGDYDVLDAVGVLDMISNGAGIAANLLGIAVMQRIQSLQANPVHLSEHFR
jgi:heme/copper-type cytochrome/quinol oxidase subunit 2